MKNRIVLITLAAIALLALVAPALSQSLSEGDKIVNGRADKPAPNRWVLEWTSSSAGTVAIATSDRVWGSIHRIVIDPGSAAPTDNYDVTLTDEWGIDLLMGQGADLDTADTSSVIPLKQGTDGTNTAMVPITINDILTLNVSNAGSAKTGKVIIYTR